jgi:hypothetical protein
MEKKPPERETRMAHFSDKLRTGTARFLCGRNGTDQLNGGLLVLYVILVFLRSFVVLLFPYAAVSGLFSLLILFVSLTVIFRVFSRNLPKRREENRRFLCWWNPKAAALSAAAARRRDREHRYFRCKCCGALCRVPRGVGRIEITCPRCQNTMSAKS